MSRKGSRVRQIAKARLGEPLRKLARDWAAEKLVGRSLYQSQRLPELVKPAPTAKGKRILCYNPYVQWLFHSNYELTILKQAQLHGAEVNYVACDGLFDMCDMFSNVVPRVAHACSACMANTARQLADFGFEYSWLGRYVPREAFARAREWEAGLAREALSEATYRDAPLGRWTKSSVLTVFRINRLDYNLPEVEQVQRALLRAGVLAYEGLLKLMTEYRPDVLFLFNGRMSSPRIAFEVARRLGVRVICHERGFIRDTLRMSENEHCLGTRMATDAYRAWDGVPLNTKELEGVASWLRDRRGGRNFNWLPSSRHRQTAASVRDALGLDAKRPVALLLPSSDDEIGEDADWGMIFPNQVEWMRVSLAYFNERPEFQAVLRVHPNIGAKNLNTPLQQFLDAVNELRRQAGPNVRIVMPDDRIDTYALMDLAAAGIPYVSAAGVEMACQGKPVLYCGRSFYYGLPFAESLQRPEEYPAALDRLMSRPVSMETQRLAYRFVDRYILKQSVRITSVAQEDVYVSRVTYDRADPAALNSLGDEGVARFLRVLLDDAPACLGPTEAEQKRDPSEEDRFFAPRNSSRG